MRHLSYLMVIALVATCGWAGDPAVFSGHYQWSGSAEDVAGVAREVDATVASLNFLVRPIARPRLTRSTAPYASFDITLGASNCVTFAREGARVINGKLGEAVKWEREEGVLQDVSFALTPEGRLQQTFSESDGTRVHLFTLASDGTNLTLEVAINSKRLDRPIRYRLSYIKQPVTTR